MKRILGEMTLPFSDGHDEHMGILTRDQGGNDCGSKTWAVRLLVMILFIV